MEMALEHTVHKCNRMTPTTANLPGDDLFTYGLTFIHGTDVLRSGGDGTEQPLLCRDC